MVKGRSITPAESAHPRGSLPRIMALLPYRAFQIIFQRPAAIFKGYTSSLRVVGHVQRTGKRPLQLVSGLQQRHNYSTEEVI